MMFLPETLEQKWTPIVSATGESADYQSKDWPISTNLARFQIDMNNFIA